MRQTNKAFVLIVALGLMSGCSWNGGSGDAGLYQVSTIDALLDGVYDGRISFDELSSRGKFGIGTFNALDGEMMAFDGEIYQIRSDGKAYVVDKDMKTPFAAVTNFEEDIVRWIDHSAAPDLESLYAEIDRMTGTKNIFYAIRIDGHFRYAKTRSVPRQEKPYPPLTEVAKKQPTFEFRDVEGTLVGFRCPEYLSGVNVPGYHLHFITADRSAGGHLLELEIDKVKTRIDRIYDYRLVLPRTGEFLNTDLTVDRAADLHQVEK